MPLSTKTIRTRIRSIRNTSKVTKAMELVSANKMRKASRFAQGGRAYDQNISHILEVIANTANEKDHINKHFFYAPDREKETKQIAIILFSGNRGLCGSFNSQIISFARKSAAERVKETDIKVSWIAIGKKGLQALSRVNEKIEAEFKKVESGEEATEFFNIGKYITAQFVDGKFDEVWLCFTDFMSSAKLVPQFKMLLPIKREVLEEGGWRQSELQNDKVSSDEELLFEPGKDKVLSFLLPRFIETKLYQALLESNASEHSSRMMAMKNASDACSDLTDELVFQSNELRQAGITREIIEIAGAKAAIE